jgi:hypothetical protein
VGDNHTTRLIPRYKERTGHVERATDPQRISVRKKEKKRSCYQQVEPLPHCVQTIPELVAYTVPFHLLFVANRFQLLTDFVCECDW